MIPQDVMRNMIMLDGEIDLASLLDRGDICIFLKKSPQKADYDFEVTIAMPSENVKIPTFFNASTKAKFRFSIFVFTALSSLKKMASYFRMKD